MHYHNAGGRRLKLPSCPGGAYLGNCVDLCGGLFDDATAMAQFIDNSKVEEAYDDRIVGINGKVKWIHDLDEDVHFFFEALEQIHRLSTIA